VRHNEARPQQWLAGTPMTRRNTKGFDTRFFLFGYYNYCDEALKRLRDALHLCPLELWKLSYFGSDFINSNIKSGKKYYNEVEIIINKWIEDNIDKNIINYKDNCKILLFNK
jgi:hypothetical protein